MLEWIEALLYIPNCKPFSCLAREKMIYKCSKKVNNIGFWKNPPAPKLEKPIKYYTFWLHYLFYGLHKNWTSFPSYLSDNTSLRTLLDVLNSGNELSIVFVLDLMGQFVFILFVMWARCRNQFAQIFFTLSKRKLEKKKELTGAEG